VTICVPLLLFRLELDSDTYGVNVTDPLYRLYGLHDLTYIWKLHTLSYVHAVHT